MKLPLSYELGLAEPVSTLYTEWDRKSTVQKTRMHKRRKLREGGGLMQFPRKMMTTTELHEECGISKSYLRQMAHVEGQKCALQKPGGRKFYFDTEKLAKMMEKYAAR